MKNRKDQKQMKLTNKLGLPQPFVEAVKREYTYKEKQYSVTSLLKGTMQTILERRYHDVIEQDVADMVWLIFGTAVHSVLENAQEGAEELKENKMIIPIGDYKLSGIFDLYNDKTKTVTDYKTGSVWKVIFDDWDDYKKQLLCYAYMLRTIGFDCKRGEIVMLLKDFSKTKAKTDANYPNEPVYVKKFEFTEKEIEEAEKFIFAKFEEIKRCEKLSDDELPVCTPTERWHKGDKYAVMKKGRKTAIRLCDSEEEAEKYIVWKGIDDGEHYVEFREGTDGKCVEYCNVNKYCPFYKKKYESNC